MRLALALVVLAGTQAAAPPRPVPVAPNTIAARPDAFYGQVVSMSSAVVSQVSGSVFVVSHDVIVIAPALSGSLDAKAYVTVVGEAMRFDPAEIASRAKDYALDLTPDAIAKYQGRPAILATSVVTADMVDVGKRLPPPLTPEEEAFDKVMKRIGPAFNELRTAATASNAPGVAEQAKVLKAAFADADVFWKGRPAAADALDWNRTVRAHVTVLERAAAAGKWDQVKTSVADVTRMCSTCHTPYRERLEDGTYRVKAAPPAK